MPKDRSLLEKKLAFSQRCFEKGFISKGESGLFLFVLEKDDGVSVGMSAIKTYFGHGSWALAMTPQDSQLEWVELDSELSELCSLYLDPSQRHHLWGKALSYSRFFFMKTFPDFFEDKILAQLRGWILPSGDCPFWDEINFLAGSASSKRLSFKEAHHLVATGKTTVRELLPGPLPKLKQFSSDLHSFIGQAHEHTAPAQRLLQEILFHKQPRLDPLDAGPHYEKDRRTCPLMFQIQDWELKAMASDVGHAKLDSYLALLDVSTSKHPCDFSLELVHVKAKLSQNCLLLETDTLEKYPVTKAKALLLEPFHPPLLGIHE
jgi:arginine N-succinyltransferase